MGQRTKRRNATGIRPFLSAAYDNVHMALWAMLIAGLIVMGTFGVPSLLAARSAYEARQVLAVEAEEAFYCSKWGMGAGTSNHNLCMSDLAQFRRGDEKRMADESFF